MKRLVVLEIQVSKKNPEHCGTSATGERCPWYVKYETLRRIDGVGVHACRMFDTRRSPLEGPPLRAPDCIAGEGRSQDLGLAQPEHSDPQGRCHHCHGPLSWSPRGTYCHHCEGDDGSGGCTT